VSISSFLRPFLDGFTGAGLARKLTIPGEPIPGFAPIQGTLSEIFLGDYKGQYWHIHFGNRKVKLKILDARIDAHSGNLFFTTESASGKVHEVHVEKDSIPSNMASAFQGPAR